MRILICLSVAAAALTQGPGPLAGVSTLRNAVSKRISSWDKSGGNRDSIRISPGETVTLAEMRNAGAVKHIWITINS